MFACENRQINDNRIREYPVVSGIPATIWRCSNNSVILTIRSIVLVGVLYEKQKVLPK